MNSYKHPLRVGVGGPVGSGKTALLEALCKAMRDTWQLAVVTNDIYTLSATFSPELADLTIYVIDVAEGEKIPRKGGPGITKSDFLVINKTDLAPYVGASLEVMASDTQRMRGDRPWTFTNLKQGDGLSTIIAFLEDKGMLGK